VWTYLARNQGLARRTLNYLSFVPVSIWRAVRLGRFDVILATSPQFFNAVAGWLAGSITRTPWIFELRDLWPESIAAVNAVRSSWVLRWLEAVELHLYRSAKAVVCLTGAFMDNLQSRGVPREKIEFIPNGVEPSFWQAGDGAGARARLGIGADAFVAAYVGTVGMAHGLNRLLEAAALLRQQAPGVRLLVVGDGAERESLQARSAREGLTNVIFTGLVSRSEARDLLLGCDVALVLLRDTPLFRTVLPSKMLEAFAARRPVILGVEGEARSVLERAGAGIGIPPENAPALAAAILHLAEDDGLRARMGNAGRAFVKREFSREIWAQRYLDVLHARATPSIGGD
jgi:glycosyltransferase involved in cell wall biosynthesis